MNAGELWPYVAIMVVIVSAAWFLWNRIHSVKDALAEHRLHCAETYVSKEGLKEVRDEIMHGVRDLRASVDTTMRDVKSSLDDMNRRIDRVIEAPRSTSTRSRSTDR